MSDLVISAIIGVLAGMITMLVIVRVSTAVIPSPEQTACERPLPRTEKCVPVWVPEKTQ